MARSFSIRCCFAKSDAYVFCGSEDFRVYAWDLVEGKIVARLGAMPLLCECAGIAVMVL